MTTADVTVYDKISADVPVAETSRPSILLLATGLVSAAVLMGFTAMVGFYLSERAEYLKTAPVEEPWLNESIIPLTQPNFMLLTVGLSAVTALWAVYSVRNDDNANAYIAIGLTILFGLSQIAQTFFLLSLMELELASEEKAVWLYSIIGSQIALMMMAILYLALTGLRTLGGSYSSKDYEGMASATFFWIVSGLVYVLVWYVVYITK